MKTIIKKILLLLMVAVVLLNIIPMTALAADGAIMEDGTYHLSEYGNSSTITIVSGLAVTLEGSAETTYTNVRIVCGAGVNLTLNNVKINNAANVNSCALSFTGEDNGLTLAGENTLQSGNNQPGVKVEGATQLTIQGDGRVTATGGNKGAGIGGGDGKDGGNITISGGDVSATGTLGAGTMSSS